MCTKPTKTPGRNLASHPARHHIPPSRNQRASMRPASPAQNNTHARPRAIASRPNESNAPACVRCPWPKPTRMHGRNQRNQRACMCPARTKATRLHARACTPMQKHDKQNKTGPLVLEPASPYLGTSFHDQSSSVCFMLRVHPTPYLIRANMEKILLTNHSLVC